jgi:hypothetical protein
MAQPFEGFDGIKKHYPSAQFVEMTVPLRGRPLDLLREVTPYMSKINKAEFRGHPASTLMCMGPAAEDGRPIAVLGFVSRPEGWNTAYCEESAQYEEICHVDTGKGPHEPVDFTPLSRMIDGDV